MNTKTLGRDAEAAVAANLKSSGHKIIDMNWSRRVCEIDIISEKDRVVYFTEVKFRASGRQGDGLEYVSKSKQNQMAYAATIWCSENNYEGDYRLMAAGVKIKDSTMSCEIVEITLN